MYRLTLKNEVLNNALDRAQDVTRHIWFFREPFADLNSNGNPSNLTRMIAGRMLVTALNRPAIPTIVMD
jgi:hypothetical protein